MTGQNRHEIPTPRESSIAGVLIGHGEDAEHPVGFEKKADPSQDGG